MDRERERADLLPLYSLLAKSPTLMELRMRSLYSRRLERLWAFVEKFYSDSDIHLAEAARYSGLSPDHLNHLLQRFTATTFHDLLSRYRIEKCLELLHDKNYTLTEVYGRCGFNSATTFERQFKKWVGCLPSEYKRQVKSLRVHGSNKIVNPKF